MSIFVVFASGQVDTPIIHMLCAPGFPDLIGYSRYAADAVVRILEIKPSVVLIDSRNAESEALTVLQGIEDFALAPVRIVLTNVGCEQNDQKSFMEEGIYHFQFPEEERDLCLALAGLGKLDRAVKVEHECSVVI